MAVGKCVVSPSPRELQALHLVMEGLSNKEAADRMGISPRTFEVHKQNLLAKFRTKSPVVMALIAVKTGLVKLEAWSDWEI